jgi:hypothetical protein
VEDGLGRVLSKGRSSKEETKRFPVAEALGLAGGLVAVVGGFLWASTAALHNAFYSFFGERRFVLPLPYEEMIYQGALNQVSVFVGVLAAVLIGWSIWGELDDFRFPNLVKARGWILDAGRTLSFLLVLALLWLVADALLRAERQGIDRARSFAVAAESGHGPFVAVRKRFGDRDISITGFKIGCSEKLCLLYQPTDTKTALGADGAAGRTVQVTLDNLLCASTTTLARGDGRSWQAPAATSCVAP